MSVILYGVGALALMVGAVMIGIGIPVNEFSFGNTMILAGTTSMVGGLVVAALGAVVAQLQRLSDALGAPVRASRPVEAFEPAPSPRAAAVPAARVPFPSRPKPKSDLAPRELAPEPRFDAPSVAPVNFDAPPPGSDAMAKDAPPMLRNPFREPEEAATSATPATPATSATPAEPEPDFFDRPAAASHDDAVPEPEKAPRDEEWRLPPLPEPPAAEPKKSYFDAMWPAKPAKRSEPVRPDVPPAPPVETAEAAVEPHPEPLADRQAELHDEPAPPEAAAEPERRNVEILKSGVVDGMSYTLYVDGSIEAELPQGTLHFASINDLRDHLERNA